MRIAPFVLYGKKSYMFTGRLLYSFRSQKVFANKQICVNGDLLHSGNVSAQPNLDLNLQPLPSAENLVIIGNKCNDLYLLFLNLRP